MGGLIGMVLAAGEHPPMARLVINDIGPFVPAPGAGSRSAAYLGLDLGSRIWRSWRRTCA